MKLNKLLDLVYRFPKYRRKRMCLPLKPDELEQMLIAAFLNENRLPKKRMFYYWEKKIFGNAYKTERARNSFNKIQTQLEQ